VKIYNSQIATVQGGIRDCGDSEYPGLYVRLDDPVIRSFIESVLNFKGKFIFHYFKPNWCVLFWFDASYFHVV
jgi:hypothetical protein